MNQGNESAIDRVKNPIVVSSGLGDKESPKTANKSIEANKELEELRERLALLEAQNNNLKATASDNTPPIIRITSLNVEGLRAIVSAEVTDNLSVGEVTLNGSLPKKINGSTYLWGLYPIEWFPGPDRSS